MVRGLKNDPYICSSHQQLNKMNYSRGRLIALVLLRVAIGWHFLYEGASKLLNPAWSSRAYLLDSQGPFSGIFHWLAENSVWLAVVDGLNKWGLALVGLGLIIGFLTSYATWAAIILLSFYYIAQPPWPGLEYLFPSEGTYFIVNKNLIEILALVVLLYFPTGQNIGVDRFFLKGTKTD